MVDDCAIILHGNLKEEKAADQKLTDIAESQVNVEASMGTVAICVGIEFGAISSMTKLPDHAARSTV